MTGVQTCALPICADKQDIAEINALGQLVVNRNDLLLRLLMMSKKVTDAQMDAHFGISG